MPVIHVLNAEQMSRNLAIVVASGADGTFLINHGSMWHQEFIGLYSKAVETYPDFWIGLNCLDLESHEVFDNIPDSVDGIWTDNGGVYDENTTYAERISKSRETSSFTGTYFGGVAFKGQNRVDAKKSASLARGFMDVVTTSGDGTGIAAAVDKIASMKEAIGDYPLAIASGITVDNVEKYLPYVDYFLVATGISRTFHELDPAKVGDLAKAIHGF